MLGDNAFLECDVRLVWWGGALRNVTNSEKQGDNSDDLRKLAFRL